MATQCNQSQYPNLDNNFAQPQLIAQPNFEDLDPNDTPSAVPTALQPSIDHPFNPKCAHNLMVTQCNQSQYLTSLNKICVHYASASQNNQISLCNSLASPYPPILGNIDSIPKESAKFGGFPPSHISRTIQPISITNNSICL